MDGLNAQLKLAVLLGLCFAAGASCSTPEYVGSRDCAELVKELDVPWFAETCQRCQGSACTAGDCKDMFPCQDGKIIVQGCEEDSDCSELKALCAQKIAKPNHVCTVSDAS